MINKTIYKTDSKGKLRFINISTNENKIIQESGLVGSPNTVTNISECIAKNIGKANATTAEGQAIAEAKAKLKKKLEEGYYETPEEAQGGDLVLPMLAKDFKKEEKKVKYPCYAQPKFDGMRCLKDQTHLTSRTGKAITTMSHITQELSGLVQIFDGELYAHGESFQRNMELIKKYRPGESEQVKYHIYDVVHPELGFKDRLLLLQNIFQRSNVENLELVETREIKSKEELLEYHKENLERGYEGTMVRHGDEGYGINKRSSSLLKFKDFQDIACKIVDVKPSEKRSDQGSFICELPEKKWCLKSGTGKFVRISDTEFEVEGGEVVFDYPTFGCGMRFSHEERQDIINNPDKYIGQTAEIRFFEYSDEGIPRFPVCVGLRLDK
jgi:DNA ligase-1